MCSTGDVTQVIEGGRTGLNFRESLEECPGDGPYDVIHTHPNGIKDLSPTDRKAAASEDISSICVAVPDGIKCESMSNCATDASGALTCDVDSCEREAPEP